jgi:hypothetical protein
MAYEAMFATLSTPGYTNQIHESACVQGVAQKLQFVPHDMGQIASYARPSNQSKQLQSYRPQVSAL